MDNLFGGFTGELKTTNIAALQLMASKNTNQWLCDFACRPKVTT